MVCGTLLNIQNSIYRSSICSYELTVSHVHMANPTVRLADQPSSEKSLSLSRPRSHVLACPLCRCSSVSKWTRRVSVSLAMRMQTRRLYRRLPTHEPAFPHGSTSEVQKGLESPPAPSIELERLMTSVQSMERRCATLPWVVTWSFR